MISLFDFEDLEMRHAKDGDFERENSQRWNENNRRWDRYFDAIAVVQKTLIEISRRMEAGFKHLESRLDAFDNG